MRLSEIQEISKTQYDAIIKQDIGLKRQLLPSLPDIKSHALVISGIRRCGKSTLLRQFLTEKLDPWFYLNFDDIRLLSFNSEDYKLLDKVISDSGVSLLFFDEVQSAINWELYIRQKLDEGFQILITGSNASLLSRELGTHLTGRHISKELFPFSYTEFCKFLNQDYCTSSLTDYLNMGGFPEYLKTENMDILTQLQSDIIYRDIAVRYGIRDTASLERLFLYLVSNPAQLFSPSKLSGILGTKSPTTVLEYISYLESAYLLSILPCFSWSLKTQSLLPKKAYITDSGIIKTTSISFSNNLGALLENMVFINIYSQLCYAGNQKEKAIFYYKDKNEFECECDFIVSPHSKPECIQVCWELSYDNQDREIKGLLNAMVFFNIDKGTILTFDTEDLIKKDSKTINVIPAWKYFGEQVE